LLLLAKLLELELACLIFTTQLGMAVNASLPIQSRSAQRQSIMHILPMQRFTVQWVE